MQASMMQFRFSQFRLEPLVFLLIVAFLGQVSSVLADAGGTIVFTQRFDGTPTIVNEVDWTYVRATPSLDFSNARVIWTGAGASMVDNPNPPPDQLRVAGSDGLFYRPDHELLVGNWQGSQFWVFDPTATDVIIDGPSDGGFAFHLLLHPNENDFLASPALSAGPSCTDQNGPRGCFGVYDHTPLTTTNICLAPQESVSGDDLQPVSFVADENLNMFVLFTDATSVQFGGAGFASFDLDTTSSTFCSAGMSMTERIPPGIMEAHSVSWDPFLSDANNVQDPHSDFIVFANSTLAHIRVDDPGTPGATATVIASIDMATEAVCASGLPAGQNHEFDQGALDGGGIALVGDESNGFVALVDYSQNTNGTILDGANTVCLTKFLHDGIDDIAPLTGLGALSFFGGKGNPLFKHSFEESN
jgi:hypothetical protein